MKLRFVLFLITFWSVMILHASPVQETFSLGEKAFKSERFEEARNLFNKVLNMSTASKIDKDAAIYNIKLCDYAIRERGFKIAYKNAYRAYENGLFDDCITLCYNMLKCYKSKQDAISQLINKCTYSKSLKCTEKIKLAEDCYAALNFYEAYSIYLDILDNCDKYYNPDWLYACEKFLELASRGRVMTRSLAEAINNPRVSTFYLYDNGIFLDYYIPSEQDRRVVDIDIQGLNLRIPYLVHSTYSADDYEIIDYHGNLITFRRKPMSINRPSLNGKIILTGEGVNPIEAYDMNGEEINIPNIESYASIARFSEGKAPFKNKITNKWGFIDSLGNELIPANFDYVTDFSENRSLVNLNGDWCFIDETGNVVVRDISPIIGKTYAFVNGKWIEKNTYSNGYSPNIGSCFYKEGLCVVSGEDKALIIDKFGKVIFSVPKELINNYSYFSEHLMCLGNSDSGYGYVDSFGNYVVKLDSQIDIARPFSCGRAVVRDRNSKKYGFIDNSGNFVIRPLYDYAETFSEGIAAVSEKLDNGQSFFINDKGDELFGKEFDFTTSFKNGFGVFLKDGIQGLIDVYGITNLDF